MDNEKCAEGITKLLCNPVYLEELKKTVVQMIILTAQKLKNCTDLWKTKLKLYLSWR